MRIYTKIRIDLKTGKTIEEESFEYFGPMALCWDDDGEDEGVGGDFEGDPNEDMGGGWDGDPDDDFGGWGDVLGEYEGLVTQEDWDNFLLNQLQPPAPPGTTFTSEAETRYQNIKNLVKFAWIGLKSPIPGGIAIGAIVGYNWNNIKAYFNDIPKAIAATANKLTTEHNVPPEVAQKIATEITRENQIAIDSGEKGYGELMEAINYSNNPTYNAVRKSLDSRKARMPAETSAKKDAIARFISDRITKGESLDTILGALKQQGSPAPAGLDGIRSFLSQELPAWQEAVTSTATAGTPGAALAGAAPAGPAPGTPADYNQRLSDLLNSDMRIFKGGFPASETGAPPPGYPSGTPPPDPGWTGQGDPWANQRPVDDSGMLYTGGSQYFDESTGQYRPPTTGGGWTGKGEGEMGSVPAGEGPVGAAPGVSAKPGFEAAMGEFRNVNTDIKFIHDMSELEGVTLSDEEKKFLETMRVNATTNLTNTVNEATLDLAEAEIARMVNRGVLQGNIGSETMSKIYEASGKVVGEQSRNIESDVARMGLGVLEQKKTNQMGLWGQELTADIASATAGTDKWKSIGLLETAKMGQEQEWNQNLITALTTMRGQDIGFEGQKLGAETSLNLAGQEMSAWRDAQNSAFWSNIGGAIISAW